MFAPRKGHAIIAPPPKSPRVDGQLLRKQLIAEGVIKSEGTGKFESSWSQFERPVRVEAPPSRSEPDWTRERTEQLIEARRLARGRRDARR